MSNSRINKKTGKLEYYLRPTSSDFGIWVQAGFCERCAPYNECLGLSALDEKEMINLDALIFEAKTLSADQIEFHGQTIENLFAWYFSKMMMDDLIFLSSLGPKDNGNIQQILKEQIDHIFKQFKISGDTKLITYKAYCSEDRCDIKIRNRSFCFVGNQSNNYVFLKLRVHNDKIIFFDFPESLKTLGLKLNQQINPDTGEKVYNKATAFSLMVFYAFAMQCMSTLAVVYRETKGWKWPLIQTVYMTALAYFSALLVYQILS